jgi:hypothetical protein
MRQVFGFGWRRGPSVGARRRAALVAPGRRRVGNPELGETSPNHSLERTAPVASRRVPPLNYVRSAASRTWVSSPWLGLHGTVGLGTGRHR